MRSCTHRIVDSLLAWRMPLLLLAVVAGTVAFVPARRLEFDRSIENMFAPGDPLLAPYDKLKRTFGGNEIVLAVYADEDLLHADGRGIQRLAEVSGWLKRIEGVADVVSLDQPLGTSIVDPGRSRARPMQMLFEGYTHSADGRIAAVACMLQPESDCPVPREEVIRRLRQVMETLPAPLHSGFLAGAPVMLADGFQYIEADGRRLGWTSMLLLAAVILACFRSIRWVIVPIAVVELALALTRATLKWSSLELSMVSSMLTAVVTVVGIATVVHVIVRFREARDDGLAPRRALRRAGVVLAAPVFWACSTTAVGFASLTVAEVGPVQDFGRMMAIGAVMVLVSVALVVPGLALFGRRDADPKRAWGENVLDRQLNGVVRAVQRRPKALGLLVLLACAAVSAGVYRLEVESDFTRNFHSDSPIVRSYEFVETRLGGAGLGDVILPAPKELKWEYLRKVRKLENRLRREVVLPGDGPESEPALTKVLSLADGVVAASPTDPDRMRSGFRRGLQVDVALRLFTRKMPALVEALHGEDPEALTGEDPDQPGRYYLRVMFRAREQQPAARRQSIIAQVERIGREEFPPAAGQPGAEVTGFFVLLTSLIDSMLRDQWITFGVAILAIGLMMCVALRGPVLALVALVPNVLPIAVVTGLMGWLGLKINMGAAMIAAVSMGLSIDSSIHYLIAFRRQRADGKSLSDALAAVHQTVGRAMVFSTLALIVGFTLLTTSQFVPTIYFGVLVSLTMLGGLAGNLVVLPLLLKLVTRETPILAPSPRKTS